jgi:hypothetical protein
MSRWRIATCAPSFFVLFMARRSWNSLDWQVQNAGVKRIGEWVEKPGWTARIRPMPTGCFEVQDLGLPGTELMHSFPTGFPQTSKRVVRQI